MFRGEGMTEEEAKEAGRSLAEYWAQNADLDEEDLERVAGCFGGIIMINGGPLGPRKFPIPRKPKLWEFDKMLKYLGIKK